MWHRTLVWFPFPPWVLHPWLFKHLPRNSTRYPTSVILNTGIFTWVNLIKYGITLVCRSDLWEAHKRDPVIDLEGFLMKYPKQLNKSISSELGVGKEEAKNKHCKCSETREPGQFQSITKPASPGREFGPRPQSYLSSPCSPHLLSYISPFILRAKYWAILPMWMCMLKANDFLPYNGELFNVWTAWVCEPTSSTLPLCDLKYSSGISQNSAS